MLVNGVQGGLISIRDRGLLYGDGVFRTLLVRAGQARNWPLHYQKLQHDCRRLNIACPEIGLLARELDTLLSSHTDGVFKLIVTRGEGQRGYAPPPACVASHLWDISPRPVYPPEWLSSGIKVRICDLRLCHQPRLAGIKHLNRLENVLAAAEWCDAQIAEGLLLDNLGNVIGGTRSNVFIYSQGHLITPDLSRCGVDGVQRQRLIAWAEQQRVALQVRAIHLDELLQADEVFLTNSVIGLWSVRELNTRHWQSFPMADRIRREWHEGGK
ncbi:MAG: aminodeoxychorismate lyase [Pseudomonadota bacterium]